MGSHFYPSQQPNLWEEFKEAVQIAKQLSDVYNSSVLDLKPESTEMLMAFRRSSEKAHVALETVLNSFIAQKYDDGHNKASNIEIRHDQTQVSAPGIPQYQSISQSQERMPSSEGELRSETNTQYPCETEFRPQSVTLHRSLSNSHIPTLSRNVYWPSSNSPNLTQCEVKNKSRSKSQDQHELGTKSMYSSMTRNQPEFKNVNMSPPNYRNQKRLGRRIRSRSRSYNEPRFGSRSRYSSKNRHRSLSRSRRKSKSLDRRDNERQSSSKPRHDRSFKFSKNYKFKKEIGKRHPPPNKKKGKNINSTQPTQPTSSSDTSSQLEEQPPTPVVDSGPTVIPPPVAPQVQVPFYSQNVTTMYYAQPTHMRPQLMPVPYYMPPRSRLPYPPTYPRLLYRPQWQPPVRNYGTQ